MDCAFASRRAYETFGRGSRIRLNLPKEGKLMTNIDAPTAAETAASETPNPLSLADTVWNQIAASMDYPIYVLNAVREKFLQVSDDPNVVMFYREDARKNVALMNEAEVHLVTALQLIKQALPILAAKYEKLKDEFVKAPSASALVN
jgi:hypothetical protein